MAEALDEQIDSPVAGDPAEIGPRIGAGLIDALLLSILATALSLSPLAFGGLALPMFGVFISVIVYSIVPAAVFKSTLGMRLLGVELVHLSGRTADATELVFRELIGRGMFGFAYFGTVIFGIAGYLTGSIGFFQPTGIGLLLFVLSGLLVTFGIASHIVVLTNRDRRGLHDFMGNTIVITRGTARAAIIKESELDEDERRFEAEKRSRRLRNFFIAEVVLVALAVALPYVLSRPSTAEHDFAARMKVKKAARVFEADPTNARAAHHYADLLEISDEAERAMEVRLKHRSALIARDTKQEAAIRASRDRDPKNWDTFSSLIVFLGKHERKDAAHAEWKKYLELESSADIRTTYGIWLYDNGYTKEAVDVLKQAIIDGREGPSVHAYLGWALLESNDKDGARSAFKDALAIDPELWQVKNDLARLEAELQDKPNRS